MFYSIDKLLGEPGKKEKRKSDHSNLNCVNSVILGYRWFALILPQL